MSKELYEELLGSKEDDNEHHLRVSDRLIDLVIHACDLISEQVNMYDDSEKIRWLLDHGFTVEEIKEFVGRV
jgi:hypothetical protein